MRKVLDPPDRVKVLHSVPNGTVFSCLILISTHIWSLTGPLQKPL
jgi:hypothetical protein